MSSKLIVKTAYANIYSEPKFSSQLVTQALFFETLEVVSYHGEWVEVSQWDDYKGYVHQFYLSEDTFNQDSEFLVEDRLIPLYGSVDFNNPIMIAPFGSRIPIDSNDNGYYVSKSINDRNYFFKGNISTSNNNRHKMIENSKKLIGSPYLWGGKTPFGYDCSGFVQQVFKSMNISLKRDTSEQIEDDRMNSIDIESVTIGDILFFNMDGNGVDHVGISLGQNQIIHCGGEVKIQSIDDESNKRLRDYIIKVKSVRCFFDE